MQYELGLVSQRWTERRTRFVPPSLVYDPGRHGVTILKRPACAKLIEAHHYLRSCPVVTQAYGLWRKDGVHASRLVGCAVFGMPASQSIIPARTGLPPEAGLELTRFMMTDEVEFNGETAFIAMALRDLARSRPHLAVIVAHSDGTPRMARNGTLTHVGHIGQIYSASNALYTGRSDPRTIHVNPNGDVVPDRLFSKIRRGTRGLDRAVERLVDLGAMPREVGQDPAEWLKQVLDSNAFRKVRHPGMHAFVLPLRRWLRRDLERSPGHLLPAPRIKDRAIQL